MSDPGDTIAIAIVGLDARLAGASGAAPRQLLLDCAETLCARRRSRETGLFVGVDGRAGNGAGPAGGDALASELAREMGLLGPAVSVASALCPALAAVDRACRSLRLAECRLALVAEMPAAASAAGGGAGALLLRRLGEALFDGDRIVAVVRGSLAVLAAGQAAAPSAAEAATELRHDAAAMSGLFEAVLLAEQGLPAAIAEPTATTEAAGTRRTRRVVATATRDGQTAQLTLGPPPARGPASLLEPAAEPRAPRPRPELARAYAPPENPLEAAIAELWQVLLGVQAVGIHDNFIELGGDSITGVKVVAALREWLHQEIPTVSLYDAPTVAALTQLIVTGGAAPRAAHEDVQARGERRRAKLQRMAQERLAAPAAAPPGTASNETSG